MEWFGGFTAGSLAFIAVLFVLLLAAGVLIIAVPFIINEQNCIFRQMFEQYLKAKAIQVDHTIELWSIPTIKKLVISNLGISFLPKFTVQEELERGELVEIPTEITRNHISAICGHVKSKWISPLMKEFINLCKSEVHALGRPPLSKEIS